MWIAIGVAWVLLLICVIIWKFKEGERHQISEPECRAIEWAAGSVISEDDYRSLPNNSINLDDLDRVNRNWL